MEREDDEQLDDGAGANDPWREFADEDIGPIRIVDLKALPLESMPDGVSVSVLDDNFPDVTIHREGDELVCSLEEHMYTKYWTHKFSAYSFAKAMERAVRRLTREGHPFASPSRDDDDVHIFVRWDVRLPSTTSGELIVASIKAAFELVWHRADSILQDSDSVLVLGKDTGAAMERLKRIADKLESLGYFTWIIKDEADKVGEGVMQKVMRYALSSKFVVVENSDPSGHLYEFPHVAKAAECITVVLQEEGKGATWMFEDGFAKHKHWHKEMYADGDLERAVEKGASWAEGFSAEFANYQLSVLPWFKPQSTSTV